MPTSVVMANAIADHEAIAEADRRIVGHEAIAEWIADHEAPSVGSIPTAVQVRTHERAAWTAGVGRWYAEVPLAR